MCIDGDVLEIDLEIDLEEVKALQVFAKDRLAYIEEIVVVCAEGERPVSSALYALLFCLKHHKPTLKIDALDAQPLALGVYGNLYWIKP